MEILIGHGYCKIRFCDSDSKYAGVTVDLYGEGNPRLKKFCVFKNHLDTECWVTYPDKNICSFKSLNSNEKNELLSHCIQCANNQGYTIQLW